MEFHLNKSKFISIDNKNIEFHIYDIFIKLGIGAFVRKHVKDKKAKKNESHDPV